MRPATATRLAALALHCIWAGSSILQVEALRWSHDFRNCGGERNWFPAQETGSPQLQGMVAVADEINPVPTPPPPPQIPPLEISYLGLQRRQDLTGTQSPSDRTSVCGFVNGSAEQPLQCPSSEFCVLNATLSAVGCCRTIQCDMYTACLGESLASQVVSVGINTLLCTAAAAPQCVTHVYQGSVVPGFSLLACGKRATTDDIFFNAITPVTSMSTSKSTSSSTSTSTSSFSTSTVLTSSSLNTTPASGSPPTSSTAPPPSSAAATPQSTSSSAAPPPATLPSIPSSDKNSRVSQPVIIGLILGIFLALLLIALCIWCMLRRKKKQQQQQKQDLSRSRSRVEIKASKAQEKAEKARLKAEKARAAADRAAVSQGEWISATRSPPQQPGSVAYSYSVPQSPPRVVQHYTDPSPNQEIVTQLTGGYPPQLIHHHQCVLPQQEPRQHHFYEINLSCANSLASLPSPCPLSSAYKLSTSLEPIPRSYTPTLLCDCPICAVPPSQAPALPVAALRNNAEVMGCSRHCKNCDREDDDGDSVFTSHGRSDSQASLWNDAGAHAVPCWPVEKEDYNLHRMKAGLSAGANRPATQARELLQSEKRRERLFERNDRDGAAGRSHHECRRAGLGYATTTVARGRTA